MTLGRRRPLFWACAMLVSALGSASGAQTAPFTVSLDYERDAACPEVEKFESLVTARLGYDPFSEGASDHVLVHVAQRGGALEGRIEWRDSTGKWAGDQTVPGPDCRHLVHALAVALTVQIQLLATTAASQAVAAPPTRADHQAETPTPQPVPPPSITTISASEPLALPPGRGPAERPATPRLRLAFAMGAGTSVGFGMASSPVLLGRVLGSLAGQHLSVELAAEASVASTTRRADGAGFSQRHLLASAAACATLTRWSACLLANAGKARMAGENIDRPTSAVVPIIQTGARVGIVQLLGSRLFVHVHADGLVNVTRWTAALDQVPVWTAPRFSAVLGVDVGARLR